MIDLKTFETAIGTFDEILARYAKEYNDDAIRDAVIQRFEYTYSLALKTLIRYLRFALPETAESVTFNQTIREANKMGLLLSDLETWDNYRQKRNLSSHTYNIDVAMEVIGITKDFNKEVHYLLEQLKAKL